MKTWNEQRHAPSPGTYLCQRSDIKHQCVKEFRFGGDSPFAFRMFVYNDGHTLRAYRNSCPHYDVPLNHTPEQLITSDNRHFLCMTHFAKFDINSGLCVEGPCEGESLETIPLQLDGNRLMIANAG